MLRMLGRLRCQPPPLPARAWPPPPPAGRRARCCWRAPPPPKEAHPPARPRLCRAASSAAGNNSSGGGSSGGDAAAAPQPPPQRAAQSDADGAPHVSVLLQEVLGAFSGRDVKVAGAWGACGVGLACTPRPAGRRRGEQQLAPWPRGRVAPQPCSFFRPPNPPACGPPPTPTPLARPQVYVDCTLGAGGHAAAMMRQHPVRGGGEGVQGAEGRSSCQAPAAPSGRAAALGAGARVGS
jgi:hypothetical protein